MPIESAPPFYVLSCARLRLVARILFDPASLTGREGDPQFLDLPRRHSAQLGFFPIAPDDQLEIGSGVGDVMFIETPEQYGQLIWCEGISLHDVRNERLDIELLVDVGEFDKRVDEFSFLRFVDEVKVRGPLVVTDNRQRVTDALRARPRPGRKLSAAKLIAKRAHGHCAGERRGQRCAEAVTADDDVIRSSDVQCAERRLNRRQAA